MEELKYNDCGSVCTSCWRKCLPLTWKNCKCHGLPFCFMNPGEAKSSKPVRDCLTAHEVVRTGPREVSGPIKVMSSGRNCAVYEFGIVVHPKKFPHFDTLKNAIVAKTDEMIAIHFEEVAGSRENKDNCPFLSLGVGTNPRYVNGKIYFQAKVIVTNQRMLADYYTLMAKRIHGRPKFDHPRYPLEFSRESFEKHGIIERTSDGLRSRIAFYVYADVFYFLYHMFEDYGMNFEDPSQAVAIFKGLVETLSDFVRRLFVSPDISEKFGTPQEKDLKLCAYCLMSAEDMLRKMESENKVAKGGAGDAESCPWQMCSCKNARYCSKECQRQDYPRHRKHCFTAIELQKRFMGMLRFRLDHGKVGSDFRDLVFCSTCPARPTYVCVCGDGFCEHCRKFLEDMHKSVCKPDPSRAGITVRTRNDVYDSLLESCMQNSSQTLSSDLGAPADECLNEIARFNLKSLEDVSGVSDVARFSVTTCSVCSVATTRKCPTCDNVYLCSPACELRVSKYHVLTCRKVLELRKEISDRCESAKSRQEKEEEPKAARDHICVACGKDAMMLCTRCKSVHFCDKDCQAKAWPSHKADCSRIFKERKAKEAAELLHSEGDVGLD